MKTYSERITSINDKVRTKRKRRIKIWTTASVVCVLLVLTVVCSLPILGEGAPNINAYKGDEYYPLIKKINSNYGDNRYSIFEQLGDIFNKGYGSMSPDDASPSAPSDENNSSGDKYEETTNNQVNGVIEGDLLKRSTSHAFYLKNGYSQNAEPCLLLEVYSLAGSDSAKVNEIFIRAKDETSFSQYRSYIQAEMFLSGDATRLTVLSTCINDEKVVYTTVISLDVSDVKNIKEVNRVYVSGAYLSSRKVNDKFLVITNFNAGHYGYYGYGNIDYDKKETYVPQCGSDLENSFIPIENIHVPEECLNTGYTVLALLDENSLDVADSRAVFSYTDDVYVSRDYIVVARNSRKYYKGGFDYGNEISEKQANSDNSAKQIAVCELVALSYNGVFGQMKETGVNGLIKDRYSMDEKDDVLNIFTTTRHKNYPYTLENQASFTANLYCINLSSMQVIADKENFAPAGDEVKSVRFDGDTAYVCTARGNVDPVYYFDLSDLNNITYVDTGEIEGFSVNLIKFNDLLLGIGQGAHNGILKVELYKQNDGENELNGVVSVAKFQRECGFSYEYKAHLVNAEHNLIGLHIYDYTAELVTGKPNANHNRYLLLRYDEASATLEQVYLEEFDSASDYVRAFYDDGGVYVFGTNAFKFIDLR